MKIKGLIWFDDIIEKIKRKHNVQQQEVREVLDNDPHFRFVEKGHRSGENVYAAMDKRALILSARDMTKAERRLYEKT